MRRCCAIERPTRYQNLTDPRTRHSGRNLLRSRVLPLFLPLPIGLVLGLQNGWGNAVKLPARSSWPVPPSSHRGASPGLTSSSSDGDSESSERMSFLMAFSETVSVVGC